MNRELGTYPLHLPKEREQGNVEYKLRLAPESKERFDHLVTQLKWRLAEGCGETVFLIGVSDKGKVIGLEDAEMKSSIEVLRKMAAKVEAEVSVIKEGLVQEVEEDEPDGKKAASNCGRRSLLRSCKSKKVCEILLRKRMTDSDAHFLEIRVAILGATGAGKSSFLGVLTHGIRDNGRGKARLGMLRHRHEIKTGQTSSISHHMIGFNSTGEVLNFASVIPGTWEGICKQAAKVVTFLDTCGDRKFLKTTVSGLTGRSPDYACLLVDASAENLDELTMELFKLAHALSLPTFIVLTKIDLATKAALKESLRHLTLFIEAVANVKPVVVQTMNDAVTFAESFAVNFTVPIFFNSAVNGDHLPHLYQFLNLIPTRHGGIVDRGSLEGPMICQVDDIYTVADTGLVLCGVMLSGDLRLPRDEHLLMLGPDFSGKFYRVALKSIQRQKQPVSVAKFGELISCAVYFHSNTAVFEFQSLLRPNQSATRTLSPPTTESTNIPNVRISKREKRQRRFESSLPDSSASNFDENGVGENQGTFFWSSKGGSQREEDARPHTATSAPLKLRKGLVLLQSNHESLIPFKCSDMAVCTAAVATFEANVTLISCTLKQGIHPGSTGFLHIGSIRQWATVIAVNPSLNMGENYSYLKERSNLDHAYDMKRTNEALDATSKAKKKQRREPKSKGPVDSHASFLTPGATGKVWFRFDHDCEFLQPGWTILFREQETRCVGKVTKLSGIF